MTCNSTAVYKSFVNENSFFQYMYFLRLVLATVKQRSRLVLKRWGKPPEKIRARTEVPREILAIWQTKKKTELVQSNCSQKHQI